MSGQGIRWRHSELGGYRGGKRSPCSSQPELIESSAFFRPGKLCFLSLGLALALALEDLYYFLLVGGERVCRGGGGVDGFLWGEVKRCPS